MGLSKLAEKCRVCPKVDTCKNKRMESVGFLTGPCEMEMAAGVASVAPGTVVINATPEMDNFMEAVSKQLAEAFCIPEYILCPHVLDR